MAIFNASRLFAAIFLAIAVYFAANDPAVEKARIKEAIRRAPVAYVQPATQCTSTGQVSLTFNNGVSLSHTPVVLDVLKSAKVPATFFVSPEWVGEIQLVDALLRRMLAEGHTVGFTWFGDDPRNLTATQLRSSLVAQSTKIYNACGVHPRLMRFPYNQLNQAVAQVAGELGLVLSMWNVDPADYQICESYPRKYSYTAANITAAYRTQFELFKQAGNLKSSFIGVHTDLCPVGAAIGSVIKMATEEYGYKFTDLAECIGAGAKYRVASDSAAPLGAQGTAGSQTTVTSTTTTGASATSTSTSTTTASSTGAIRENSGSAAAPGARTPSVVGMVAAVIVALALAMF